MTFDLTNTERRNIWEHTTNALEQYYNNTEDLDTAIYPTRKDVLKLVDANFESPRRTNEAVDIVIKGLSKYAVHTPNPNYFGMFNPRASFPSIIADAITATYNPQLAAWGHAPYAVEIENMLIQEIGKKFGYQQPNIDGVFTTGGQEANLTAVLAALNYKFPKYGEKGLFAVNGLPIIYCSKASHHATVKAAKVCGLGLDSVRYIEVDTNQKMLVEETQQQIQNDIDNGNIPLMIVATMGTTGAGVIDPINELAVIAKHYNLWLHADAAYGGAVVLSEDYKHLQKGIEKADSITFDAHKWLSVPMATSMFITKHTNILGQTFSISANFMPQEEDEIDKLGSYTHSIQWSRRFIGLKLYMPLLVFGWKGFNDTILHQIKMGQLLKQKLEANNWTLYNNTELPVACFTDVAFEDNSEFTTYIYEAFLESGDAWIINYPVGDKFTMRACITNYNTTEEHIDSLIKGLNAKREAFIKAHQLITI
nr:aminotransferase class V-fold PLP-dependent enzyme [uncultured Psychroserpens sp.]